MAEYTSIEWTHYRCPKTQKFVQGASLNIWEGCEKVSPACKNCYADALNKRFTPKDGLRAWGGKAPRLKRNWSEMLRKIANRAARENAVLLVFVNDMADMFESQSSESIALAQSDSDKFVEISIERNKFLGLVENYPRLIFQLLTKRPENIKRMVPAHWLTGSWPKNVWIGTTVESSEYRSRLIHLAELPAPVKFASFEPLLEDLDLKCDGVILPDGEFTGCNTDGGRLTDCPTCNGAGNLMSVLDWVIVGGESGAGARRTNPTWIRNLKQLAVYRFKKPFFFKQWGGFAPAETNSVTANIFESAETMVKLGKSKSGAKLDGENWREMPTALYEYISHFNN